MGFRIVKTAIAATIAVYIAQYFHLSSALSAGLLAVLGVDVTKRRGLRSVTARLLASGFGLMAGSLLFLLLGFHVWVICVFILTVYPVLSRLRLQDGIVTGTVVMLHLFGAGEITWRLIGNEALLLVIGLGSATAINLLYMPKTAPKLELCKTRTEELFSVIFAMIARSLRDMDTVWDGKELLEAERIIGEGQAMARQSAENSLLREEVAWPVYFAMRRQQLESTGRMMELVAQVYETIRHGETVAVLFEELSGDVKRAYYTGNVERRLIDMKREFRSMPLPETRSEFEVRAALLQLLLELEAFLNVAKNLKKRRHGSELAAGEK